MNILNGIKRLGRLFNTIGGRAIIVICLGVPVLAQFFEVIGLIVIADAFAIPMFFMASALYAYQIYRRVERYPPDSTDLVLAGISGGWAAAGIDRSIRMYARMFDKTLADAWIIAVLLGLATVFAAYHVAHVTIRFSPTKPPVDGRWFVYAALVAGALLALIMVIFMLVYGPPHGPSRM